MNQDSDELKQKLEDSLQGGTIPSVIRFLLNGASGAIPLAGGLVSGASTAWSEHEQSNINKLLHTWLKLQEDEIREIGKTLLEVIIRVDQNNEEVKQRLESPEYLKLLKKAFRDWSAAESEDKRILIRNLLANAASSKICTDDVVSLFIDWIRDYSEAHFKVIGAVYNHSGITRRGIWLRIHSSIPREDSADADLFKLLIQDLSTGHIIRQHKEVDGYGNFMKDTPSRSKSSSRGQATYTISAFDDIKEYELTGLGRQFVHYAMNEIVPRLS